MIGKEFMELFINGELNFLFIIFVVFIIVENYIVVIWFLSDGFGNNLVSYDFEEKVIF